QDTIYNQRYIKFIFPGYQGEFTDRLALQHPVPSFINPSDSTAGDGFPTGGFYPHTATVGYLVNRLALPVYFVESYIYDHRIPADSYSQGLRCSLGASYPDGTSNTILLAESYHKYALASAPTKFIYADYTDGGLTHFNQEDDQDPFPPLHFDLVESNPPVT